MFSYYLDPEAIINAFMRKVPIVLLQKCKDLGGDL